MLYKLCPIALFHLLTLKGYVGQLMYLKVERERNRAKKLASTVVGDEDLEEIEQKKKTDNVYKSYTKEAANKDKFPILNQNVY